MITTFRTLFTLSIAHGYYSEGCRDFDFIVPADTAGMLRNGKLIAKVRDGRLHVLYEADESGVPLFRMARTRLRFGMNLLNPQFSNFTAFSIPTPLYRNAAVPGKLDQPLGVILTGRFLSHVVKKTIRPVTVTVND